MVGPLFSLPLFLTGGLEDARSLTAAVPQSSDSDEIVCNAYECKDSACTCNSVHGCSCDSHCNDCPDCSDCSDCSDSPVYTAPTFTISNITESGCDVNVRPGSGYTRYRVFARLTSDPDDKSYDWTFNTSSAFTATMDSLLPKTSYTVNVCGVIGNVSDKWAGAKTFTTSSNRPSKWGWTSSNGAATTAQTQLAYKAVTGNGKTTDFSYLVWNDLINKVNEVAVAAGGRWDATYATLAATQMSASDKVLTAKRFNALRQNIGSRISTGISEVSAGDIVMGRYFTTLTSKLNEWIDTL